MDDVAVLVLLANCLLPSESDTGLLGRCVDEGE